MAPARPPPERATARYAFEPLKAHQLELRANDNLEVWVTDESGGRAERVSGEEGRVPSGHVQLGRGMKMRATRTWRTTRRPRARWRVADDDEATARARQNLHQRPQAAVPTGRHSLQPTNLQGDRCKLCGSPACNHWRRRRRLPRRGTQERPSLRRQEVSRVRFGQGRRGIATAAAATAQVRTETHAMRIRLHKGDVGRVKSETTEGRVGGSVEDACVCGQRRRAPVLDSARHEIKHGEPPTAFKRTLLAVGPAAVRGS